MNAYRDTTNSMATEYAKTGNNYWYEKALTVNNQRFNLYLALKTEKEHLEIEAMYRTFKSEET